MKYLSLSTILAACLLAAMSMATEPCGTVSDCGCQMQRCNTCIGTNPCDTCRHQHRTKHSKEAKFCQSVPETTKSKTLCFKSEREDFCLPSPSFGPLGLFHRFLEGSGCKNGCRAASCDCPQPPKKRSCGKVRTKKKLYLREAETKKSTYRCEVKSGNPSDGTSCGNGCGSGFPSNMMIEEAPLGPSDSILNESEIAPIPSA